MLRAALAALVPPACLACRAPLGQTGALCGACRAALPWLRDPCPRCALPRPCAPCPARAAPWAAAWAPVAHAGPARELVLALKLGGSRAAADAMAAQLVARLPAALRDGPAVVAVPPVAARRRRRGFDPAERLARHVAGRTGGRIADCLRRADAGGPQAGLGRRARLTRVHVRAHGKIPASVLLVDDVHTTGATLAACAAALRGAGCRSIAVATYARTLSRA